MLLNDEETILESADYVIDVGIGAGINGGEIIAEGKPNQIKQNKKSLTGSVSSKSLTYQLLKKKII